MTENEWMVVGVLLLRPVDLEFAAKQTMAYSLRDSALSLNIFWRHPKTHFIAKY